MSRTDAMLVPSDEGFNHQIADTFASVLQTDRAWTEKVCGSFGAHDGSLQIGWGFGKYINRNVFDGYGGISRGVEQRTVRASRMLMPTPDLTSVGPLHYDVVEPLKKIHVRLAPNDIQPIAFDVLFDGSDVPAALENHEFRRQFGGFRTDNDLVRYHQVGVAEGWVEVEGKRHDITPDTWYATRDHSWGVRYGVGIEPVDIMPGIAAADFPMQFLWSPMRFVRPDRSVYAIHHFYMAINIPGVPVTFHGSIEHSDGRIEHLAGLTPELAFDPVNRRLKGGKLHFHHADGSTRTINVEVVSDTGFHLGTGLYFGFDGQHHGQWRGQLHADGEHIADCSLLENAKRLHQIRDCLIRVTDTQGDAVGYANYQTIVNGEWPQLGLRGDTSFM